MDNKSPPPFDLAHGGLWNILGPEIKHVQGLVKFKLVPAVAYRFCLNLPATFSQPRTSIISGPSTCKINFQYTVSFLSPLTFLNYHL